MTLLSRAWKRYPAPRTVRISARLLGALLELLAQVADVDVDRARVAVGAVAPDRAQQLLAVEQAAGLDDQAREQLELAERQLHRLAAARSTSRRRRSSVTGPTVATSPSSSTRPPARRSTARMRLRSSARPNGLVT